MAVDLLQDKPSGRENRKKPKLFYAIPFHHFGKILLDMLALFHLGGAYIACGTQERRIRCTIWKGGSHNMLLPVTSKELTSKKSK
jgi:hypothetical protein